MDAANNCWLKLLGKADWKMPDSWTLERPELLKYVRLGGGKRPTEIRAGDRLVYYAIGWQCIFAIAEVLSDQPYEPTITHEWEEQWPWAVDVRILTKKRRLTEAPSVLVLGTTPDRRHQGYVPLTSAQLAQAEEAIA